MAIRATCSGCGKSIKGGDDWAGRTAKCPGCGATIAFAAVAATASPPPAPPLPPVLPNVAADFADDQERWAVEIPPAPVASSPSAPAKRLPTRPIYSASLGAVICMVLAALAAVGGMLVLSDAQSAIHEILGGVGFLVAIMLVVCAALCSIQKTMCVLGHYTADLAREQSADEAAMLAEIKAELEWLRNVKEKEIVRAKAAARSNQSNR